MSGSFFTDKTAPQDIDCVYLIDTADLQRVMRGGGPDAQLIWAVANSRAKSLLGLNVDAYILEWAPAPTAQPSSPTSYYETRGYWDDLWVRVRDADPRLDSIPRRGYLEVIVDGYR
jgi:hypothetical protein